jgi:hypothetical protein
MLFQEATIYAGLLSLASAYLIEPPTTAASDTAKDCSAWQVPTQDDTCIAIAENWLISEADFQAYVSKMRV